jgi:hypothetical protein
MKIVLFVSRKDHLQRRGMRNFGRWMRKVHNRTDPAQEVQWRDEAFLELKADREWAKRHGPLEGGARVAHFPCRRSSVERPRPKGRRSKR